MQYVLPVVSMFAPMTNVLLFPAGIARGRGTLSPAADAYPDSSSLFVNIGVADHPMIQYLGEYVIQPGIFGLDPSEWEEVDDEVRILICTVPTAC